jgi:hypothetical protein
VEGIRPVFPRETKLAVWLLMHGMLGEVSRPRCKIHLLGNRESVATIILDFKGPTFVRGRNDHKDCGTLNANINLNEKEIVTI